MTYFNDSPMRRRVKLLALCLLCLWVTACSIGPGTLQTRQASDLEARRIRRIAVVPQSLLGSQPASKAGGEDLSEMLARTIYRVMAPMPGWQIISDSEVREVAQTLAPASEAIRLREIGRSVYADAVITGRMLRFRERVGDEWGAKTPASVAFVIELVDVRHNDVVWSARFDETQKALSENIFAIGDIGQRGVRWLSAEQLTQEGIKKALGQLHRTLVHRPGA